MKIERIRKSHKKEIVIGGLVTICLISTIAFVGTRAKYKTTEKLEHIVTGNIKYSPYDFKIMAMYKSEDGKNYTEIEGRMPSNGYIINESKSYCTINNDTPDTEAKLYTNDNGEHVFKNLTKSDKCYLYFDKTKTISDVILADKNINTTSPDFSQLAITDEGIYSVEDGMYGGTSYYWRGAVTNNHVVFANKCWRIIRINGDGTIRLIYNGSVLSGNTCTGNGNNSSTIAVANQQYNETKDRLEYVGWTYTQGSQRGFEISSNAKIQTDLWYNGNIGNTFVYDNKVVEGKFCNDRELKSGEVWGSQISKYAVPCAARVRLDENKMPTLSCGNLADVYTLKAGAITADEVAFAGGKWVNDNNSYYLYNGQSYWTMSPRNWYNNNSSDRYAEVFSVNSRGGLADSYDDVGLQRGLRPVINLASNITFSDGDGTKDNPYVVRD